MTYGCQGTSKELIMPVLDNILLGYNKLEKNIPTSRQEIEDLIVDCFNAASERDIATGD